MFDPKVKEALQTLTDQLAEASPEVRDIIGKLQRGELDEVTAMALLTTLMGKQPGLAAGLEQAALTAFAPTRSSLETIAEDDSLMIMPPTGDHGLPRLNPVYEGALAERVQFDGDAPELRSGPMPEGGKPAVPVDTNVRNPVALGMMLEQASEAVAEELAAARKEGTQFGTNLAAGMLPPDNSRVGGPDSAVTIHEDGSVDIPTDAGAQLTVRQHAALKADQDFLAAVDTVIMRAEPEGYKTGQVPAPRTVTEPAGSALAALTPEERQEAAWTFLSTTQGRRTAVRAIAELVAVGMASEGHEMPVTTPQNPSLGTVHTYVEWTVSLGGPHNTQSSFSFIDVAAKSLLRKLVAKLDELDGPIEGARLEIMPINAVDVRTVGWWARILTGEA